VTSQNRTIQKLNTKISKLEQENITIKDTAKTQKNTHDRLLSRKKHEKNDEDRNNKIAAEAVVKAIKTNKNEYTEAGQKMYVDVAGHTSLNAAPKVIASVLDCLTFMTANDKKQCLAHRSSVRRSLLLLLLLFLLLLLLPLLLLLLLYYYYYYYYCYYYYYYYSRWTLLQAAYGQAVALKNVKGVPFGVLCDGSKRKKRDLFQVHLRDHYHHQIMTLCCVIVVVPTHTHSERFIELAYFILLRIYMYLTMTD
jgi:hypothetical protein